MSIRIGDVLDYLDVHPVNQCDDAFSALELVFHAYSLYNAMDNEVLQKLHSSAFSILNKLPESDAEQLLDIFDDWAMEKERMAFSHGIAMGIYLDTELSLLP